METKVLNLTNINFYRGENGTSVTVYFKEPIAGFERDKNGVSVAKNVLKLSWYYNEFVNQIANLSKTEMDLFDNLAYVLTVKRQAMDVELLTKLLYGATISVNRTLVKKGDDVDGTPAARDMYLTEIADVTLSKRGKAKVDALAEE